MDERVAVCDKEPCQDCPWRRSNIGRRSPVLVGGESYGWFSKKNRKRLWAGLRQGEGMTCHPTDPRHHNNSEDSRTKECAGAVILQQRELVVIQAVMKMNPDDTKEAMRIYRRERSYGLTKEAAFSLMWNAVCGHIPGLGGRETGAPNLNSEDVFHEDLEWPPTFLSLEV